MPRARPGRRHFDETADHRNRRRVRIGQVDGRAKRGAGGADRVGRVHRHGRILPQLRTPPLRRTPQDHPDAFDWELLIDQLARLAAGQPIEKPVYDFVNHVRSDRTLVVPPAEVVVIDGILLFSDPRIRDLCDVKVFVDADPDIRLIRRMRRDISKRGRPLDEIIDQYLTTVQPMHLQFVEPTKRYADVIVPRGGHNAIAIEMIVAKIQRRLAEARSAES
jgi:uridine kinase